MKKLRLDLHTHCFDMPGCHQVTEDAVRSIIAQIRARGIDGIAITEHEDKSHGFQVKEMVERLFPDVIIIPGQELEAWPLHIVELYLPDGVTFRFLAHPLWPLDLTYTKGYLHGIEVDNYAHARRIDKQKIKALAEKHNLLALSNSDAHHITDIGRYYNDVSLEELSARAKAV